MGGRLVKAVLGPGWAHLSHSARLIFAEMANTATDSDGHPRYYGGRDELAGCLYGDVDGKRPRWHYNKVGAAIAELKTAGAIRLLNDAYSGSKAEYELFVDPGEKATQNRGPIETGKATQNRGPIETERTPKTGAKGPLKQVRKAPQNRGPKERRGKTKERPSLRSGRDNDDEAAPPATEDLSSVQPTLTPEDPAKAKKGTRLDPKWEPSREVIDQMREECPGVDLKAEYLKFVDYWVAKPGQGGTKLDWTRTWRNWIRNARPPNGNGRVTRQQESDQQFDRMLARAKAKDQTATQRELEA
jgi:hypothetical protein